MILEPVVCVTNLIGDAGTCRAPERKAIGEEKEIDIYRQWGLERAHYKTSGDAVEALVDQIRRCQPKNLS